MNSQTLSRFCLFLLILLAVACSQAVAEKATLAPTPDTQATVNAGIAATSTAQAEKQSAIMTAAAATVMAQNSVNAVVATSVAATVTAMPPVPTPMPTEGYVTLTEEELQALIDESAQEAAAATNQASAATTEAAADGVITAEELTTLYAYWVYADELVYYADELLNAYYGMYGELATETIELLQAIESDLAAMSTEYDEIIALLDEAANALEQGLALAEDTLTQLQTVAQTIQTNAADLQTQVQGLAQGLQKEIENRVSQVSTLQPQNLATDRKGALQNASTYLQSLRTAFADFKISTDEWTQIAQQATDAVASLKAVGGPQLQQLADQITTLTTQLARGQMPSVQAGVGQLESALGQISIKP